MDRHQLPPGRGHGLPNVAALATGSSHTCAVLRDGTVACWGLNGYGQLGDGSSVNTSRPVAVTGLSGVAVVAAGYGHTCALLHDDIGAHWGANGFGQLGDGTTTDRSTLLTVLLP